MNYSKDSRNNMTESQKKTTKKKRKKAKVTVFRVFFISCIIALFAIGGAGLGWFIGVIKSAPDVSQLDLKPSTNYTSFVYDQNGTEIDRISGNEDRIYVTLDKIPDHLQKAVIALEDERFYTHNGIDIKGILRAVVVNLKSGKLDEGASTITQQLIKNNILTSEKKFTRKIQEQYLALQVDDLYEKDLILEYYLNTIPLGHGMNGVQAAANRYFNKDVSELTLAESVVIACITQAPTRYSPILNPENNFDKSKLALSKMVEQGYITEAEKEAAIKENPYPKVHKVQQKFIDESSHSYFVDAVIDQVIADLQSQKGWTSQQAKKALYGGGVKIYTTIDQKMQSIVDKHMANDNLFPSQSFELKLNYSVTVKKADGTTVNLGGEGIVQNESEIEAFKKAKRADWGITEADKVEKEILLKIPEPQAAFVIMDHHTGQVKALSGGRGDKEGDRVFNRATQAKRQPGSLFKVLAAYAPALDTGILAPGSILVDEPYKVGNYAPKNWYSGYRGPASVRKGVYDSMNILAVKAGQMVTIETAYDYLLNFGFTTLTPTDKGASLPLGGITEGVTPLELTAAFSALANKGVYIKPTLYTKVLDRDDNVLLENIPETHPVVKESTAYMLTDMMEDVITRGTGSRLKSTFNVNMPISGKTGTTSDDKDLLFSGYTPYYTATVWLGHDQPKVLKYKYSNHIDLWGTIMDEIHQGLPRKEFEVNTSGYVTATVCGASGKVATSLCKGDSNSSLVTDYFLKSALPQEPCDWHGQIKICKVSGKVANEFCPADQVESRTVGREPVDSADVCTVHTENMPPEATPDDPNNWWPFPLPEGETVPPNTEVPPDQGTPPPDSTVTPPPVEEVVPPPTAPETSPEAPTPPTPTPPTNEDNFFVPQG